MFLALRELADVSTGEVQVTGLSGVGRADDLYNELVRIGPKELLWNEEATVFLPEEDLAGALPDSVTKVAEDRYSLPALRKLVVSQFPDRKAELSEKDRTVILALGMLLQYLAVLHDTDHALLSVCGSGEHHRKECQK